MKKHLLETIKDLRNNKGLKLKEISEIVGFSTQYISSIIRKDPNYDPYLYNNFKLKQKENLLETIKNLRNNKKLKLREISEVVGYSHGYICHLFKNNP